MSGIDYFAWVVLLVIVVSIVGCFIGLAKLPGDMARAKGHPQADAINIAGWLGLLLTLGVVWVFAMVWANMAPIASNNAETNEADREAASLRARIAELEAQLAGGAEPTGGTGK